VLHVAARLYITLSGKSNNISDLDTGCLPVGVLDFKVASALAYKCLRSVAARRISPARQAHYADLSRSRLVPS